MPKLEESEIITTFQDRLSKREFVAEDVEVLNFGSKMHGKMIVKTDTMVQSTDIPDSMRLDDAARKSVVACISDFAAKGVRPRYCIISTSLPKSISREQIVQLARGFRAAVKEFKVEIVGGDTNQGREIVLTVCMFGIATEIVPRNGSKKDDLIYVTGPFGYTALGLDIMLKRAERIERAVKSFTRPKPRLKFGLTNGRYFTSSMDSSDGLSTTLNEMARQSGKQFVITKIPSGRKMRAHLGDRYMDAVFGGGEEYEFVFTVPLKFRTEIINSARALETPIIEIGYVDSGDGVILEDGTPIHDTGWRHFR